MRRLLRLALPLGLLAALAVPTSALAQVTVSTNSSGGLALLASSPDSRESTAVTGNTTLDSSWITNASNSRSASFGDGISGPGIPGGTATISTVVRSGGTIAGNAIAAANATPAGATQSGSTITINMTNPHNFVVGDSVVVAGVGVGGYNGTVTVTAVPTPTSFTYTINPSFNVAASPGGAIQTFTIAASPGGATESGNTVTITTTSAHALSVGTSVTIAGVGVAGYNGTFTVVATPSPTTFTYTNPTAGLAASGGGTATSDKVLITTTAAHNLTVGATATISGVAVPGYNGAFTVTSVPTATSFTYSNPIAGLAASGGGSVLSSNPTTGLATSGGGTATGPNPGLSESGNTVTVRLGNPFDHNLAVGQNVTITGAGVALYNGTWTVTGTPTSSSFTFTHPTSGIQSAWNGTVTPFATFVTAAPHSFSVGSTVVIEGVGTAGYNGTFTVLSVPSPTIFTTSSTAQLLPSGGGTASAQTTVAGIGTPASATVNPFGLDNSILWESKALPADTGNGATVTYNDPGGLAATLGASVAGDDITINLGRGSVGANANNTIAASPNGANQNLGIAASPGGATQASTIAASPGGATEVGNTVTITTTTPHNIAVGSNVTIAGVGVAGYNGTFAVDSTPTPTTLTYTNPTAGLAASGGGTTTSVRVTITTVAPHNLTAGDTVLITGSGLANYNGQYTVATTPSPTTFTYDNASSGLAGSGGGIVQGSKTVTVTTTAAHNLQVGSQVTITGVPVPDYNGTWIVQGVPTTTTFTFVHSLGGLAGSGGGTVQSSGIQLASAPGAGGAITVASHAGSTVTITTVANHNLRVGQTVTVAGLSVPEYNGTFQVLSVTTTAPFQFTYSTAAGLTPFQQLGGTFSIAASPAGAQQSPVTIAASPGGATEVGNTVTIVTSSPHGLTAGGLVNIANVGVAGYNGNFTVDSVVDATTFTYTNATAGLAASGGGTATGARSTITTTAPHFMTAGQVVTIASVGVAGYNGVATILSTPTATSFTYMAGAAGLANSGGGTVTNPNGTGGATATGLSGASESGNTVTITTRLAHGLQAGQSVVIDGVGVAGYNGPFTVDTVPTAFSFTYTNPTGGLADSGNGNVYTVTTTAAQLITAVAGGAGDFAAVAPLVTATASGTTTGRLAGEPLSTLTGGANNTIQLSQPASATAAGVNLSLSSARRNGDMAFWGNTLVQGSDRGLAIYDISDPASPALESDFSCNGASGDVSIWGNLVFRSVDVPQSTNACAGSADQYWRTTGGNHTATAQSTQIAPGFEGIRIIDISNPSAPSFVAGVATDCGSFTHTLVPDLANNRVLLYVSSFPNAAIDATPTTYGNSCKLLSDTSPAPPNQVSGHDKLTIVSVPLGAPATASVIGEVTLGLKGYNSFFAHIPGYTGDFNNTPGYKGCHDIAVSMATKTAAAACVTEGVTLNITNPAVPTVKDHFANVDIDLCATGVMRWAGGTSSQAATPNCMWGTAQFTYDGKRIIWGSSTSGHAGCGSNSTTVALSCNPRGNTNVSVDRFYDGQSTSNECETGAGTAPVRSPFNRGAFWMNDAADSSWPISTFKIPYSTDASVNRYELYSSQGCSASLGNVVPVNGKYVLPLAWQIGGMDVVDWTSVNPTELGWFDVNTSATEAGNANPLNRPAGNSALKSNAFAAYWYNGHIYVSNQAPQYGSWNPAGSRGLEVFSFTDPSVEGAFDLPHLNPQTQESLLTCAITISGSPKVNSKRTIKATVKVMGQGVKGAVVKASTKGYNASKTTPANGQASFSFKPKKGAKTLKFSVAAQTNMLGCSKSKNIAK